MPLRLGIFLTPASNPTRPMSEIIDWNLDVIRKAEAYGYDEVWVGSHLTSHYSPIACPLPRVSGTVCAFMLPPGSGRKREMRDGGARRGSRPARNRIWPAAVRSVVAAR